MHIETFELGPLHTNCYLLHTESEAVVIDAADESPELLEYLKNHKLSLVGILNTHLHFDHVSGNAWLFRATGAPLLANEQDAYLLRREMGGERFGLPPTPNFTFRNLVEGELELLGETCRVLATPGHTPGSLSYYWSGEKALFSGDVLFYRSIGRADLPGGDAALLAQTIREKIYSLPPDTIVYPGHGIPTIVGEEMRQNPYVTLEA